MIGDGDPPTTVKRLFAKDGKPALEKVNMESGSDLPGGVYVVRHGHTKWNAEPKVKMANGGVVAPGRKQGRMSKRGIWYGPKGSKPNQIPSWG
jgi:hypothetical protein